MPNETQIAVNWALTQEYTDPVTGEVFLVTKNEASSLVGKVREYFNTNQIAYQTFSYEELKPYLN